MLLGVVNLLFAGHPPLPRGGDDLRARTKNDELDGFVVEEINAAAGTVRFTNQVELSSASGVAAKEDLFRVQIEEATIACELLSKG